MQDAGNARRTKENDMSWNDGPDPYLILAPNWGTRPLSATCLPHFGMMRRASEWAAVGFPAKILKDGSVGKTPIRLAYRFSRPIMLTDVHVAAIRSKLRVTSELGSATVEEMIAAGVRREEFVRVST